MQSAEDFLLSSCVEPRTQHSTHHPPSTTVVVEGDDEDRKPSRSRHIRFRQPKSGRGILFYYPSNSTLPRRLFSVLTILSGFKFVINLYPLLQYPGFLERKGNRHICVIWTHLEALINTRTFLRSINDFDCPTDRHGLIGNEEMRHRWKWHGAAHAACGLSVRGLSVRGATVALTF
jgi:hypothetical protein